MEAEVFDPFAEEYIPRISNGKIEEMCAQLDEVTESVSQIRELVESEVEKSKDILQNTLTQMDTTVQIFKEKVRIISEKLTESLPNTDGEGESGANNTGE